MYLYRELYSKIPLWFYEIRLEENYIYWEEKGGER